MKKIWKPCKLIVLERKTSEEAVLAACKFSDQSTAPALNNNGCQVTVVGCSLCSDIGAS